MFSNGSGRSISLRDRDAVLGDGRAAEGLVDDDVAAGRPERDADRVGQLLGPGQQLLAGFVGVEQLLRHVRCLQYRRFGSSQLRVAVAGVQPATSTLTSTYFTTLARMSLSRRILSSLPSTSTSLPLYLP